MALFEESIQISAQPLGQQARTGAIEMYPVIEKSARVVDTNISRIVTQKADSKSFRNCFERATIAVKVCSLGRSRERFQHGGMPGCVEQHHLGTMLLHRV